MRWHQISFPWVTRASFEYGFQEWICEGREATSPAKTELYRTVPLLKSSPHFYPLNWVFEDLKDIPGVWIFVHGSWADSTTTAFSDLDDLIVLGPEVCSGKNFRDLICAMEQSERRMQVLDPLQHHGHWIVPRDGLARMRRDYLPPQVLSGAISVSGPLLVEAGASSENNLGGLAFNAVETIRDLRRRMDDLFSDHINLFSLKHLCSGLALLPAYVYQLQGKPVTKAHGIRLARRENTYADTCLEWTRQLRETWASLLTWRETKFLRATAQLIPRPVIHRKFAGIVSTTVSRSDCAAPRRSELMGYLNWVELELNALGYRE